MYSQFIGSCISLMPRIILQLNFLVTNTGCILKVIFDPAVNGYPSGLCHLNIDLYVLEN